MRNRARLVSFVALLATLASSAHAQSKAAYDVTIRWTSYGIPHVTAKNWSSLGYGFAYATATDAFCTIAHDVVMVNGAMSAYFGGADGNLESDVFHRSMLTPEIIKGFDTHQTPKAVQFSKGYVAGYNRYLRDHRDALPAACNGAAWVRPITELDVTKLSIGVGIRYGLGRFQKEVTNVAPPGTKASGLDTDYQTDFDIPAGIGSNAVAMGKAVTATGRGLLLGNPHYPWQGSSRFHLIHTTIPGEVDVMGVSLYTTSRIAIGFNANVAWSHTVSTGLRSTLYALELNPANPLEYKYGNGWRKIERSVATIKIKKADGSVGDSSRTVYLTHYGPIVVSPQLPWTTTQAYAIRDVNLTNDRSAITYDALNAARNIDEVEAAISLQGVSWTNTIAADKNGTAFYADISVVPNVDSAMIARCRVTPANVPTTIIVLKGADPSCEWMNDPKSYVAGAMPASKMPRLRRDDFVSNQNDSYWLSNPAAPLEGYSPIIGNERTPRSLRTRAGLTFVQEALKSGQKATPATLQNMLFSQRNYGAEQLLDGVLTLCSQSTEPVAMQSGAVDIAPSCKALAAWDRKETVGSRGAQVWREFWRFASRVPGLYKVPFNVSDPVNTPNGLAIEQPGVREALRRSLAQAQARLAQFGIAPDATLGSIQWDDRNGEHIPIPGGDGLTGMWSVISSELTKNGYSPIIAGNSYIQVIGWKADGTVDSQGILTYSQSDDPASPHYADLTKVYSAGQWIHLPFYEKDIAADKNLKTLRLRQ